jgi:hypothetical protein
MSNPTQIIVRSYQVGFGDCFLLSFVYKTNSRHVLIDFGSTALPESAGKEHLLRVARAIRNDCGGKLHAVVATHRHADHINGFDPGEQDAGSGAIIASLKPDIVIQPWTEYPNAREDAKGPTAIGKQSQAFLHAIDAFEQVLPTAAHAMTDDNLESPLLQQLTFLGETNISNRRAVKQLIKMGESGKARFVHYGSASGLNLPGVRVSVLGPPTIEQSLSITRQRRFDPEEFWSLVAGNAVNESGTPAFAPKFRARRAPGPARWIIDRLKYLPAEQLLEIVRILDGVLNNTSVILLFEVGRQILLFPGDAQVESWKYALSKVDANPSLRKQLEDVTVYKVGHHGSLNATPKTLWRMLRYRKVASKRSGELLLHTFLSSMQGIHGSADNNTEVPRRTLKAALKRETVLHSTESLPSSKLKVEHVFTP